MLEGKESTRKTFQSQNAMHMIFRMKNIFNFVFDDVEFCLHSMDCRWESCLRHPCFIHSDYTAQEFISLLSVSCPNANGLLLPYHFMLFHKYFLHPAFTQFHEEVNIKSADERESDIIVNLFLSNFLFNWKHKTLISKDGLYHYYHPCAYLPVLVLYKQHKFIYQWILVGLMFLVLKKQNTGHISHPAASPFLTHYKHMHTHTHHNTYMVLECLKMVSMFC